MKRRNVCISLAIAFLFAVFSCLAWAQEASPTHAGKVAPSSAASANTAPQSPLRIAKIMPKGVPPRLSAPAGSHLNYYGGPVISNVEVIVVFWGTGVDVSVQSGIGQYYSDLSGSSYIDLLSEYDTVGVTPVGGGTPTGQSIGHGTFLGAYTITPSFVGTTVDDTNIQAELAAQIQAGHLPAPTVDAQGFSNTLYMTYFPPGISITQGGSSSCTAGGFCAYHGTLLNGGLDVPYGVMPDMGPTSGCATGCGSGTTFDIYTAVSSHEFAEAITDADVGLATSNAPAGLVRQQLR